MPDTPYLEVATIDVQWGDVDRMQHVNNVVYFRWMETARTRYFERLPFPHDAAAQIYPILASIRCDYRQQVRYPDRMKVGYATTQIGRSSIRHAYRIESEQRGQVVALGEGTWICFDYQSQRPIPLPEPLHRAMEILEGRPLPLASPVGLPELP